jgi:hypothetical protein
MEFWINMSTNVVPLLRPEIKKPINKVIDIKNLISSVIDWAEDQGIDVQNDIGFQIRCADFMTYLELLAKEENGERKQA